VPNWFCDTLLVSGRLPLRGQTRPLIGMRCSTDLHSASPQLRARYIKTTVSVSVRTLILPEGCPPQVHGQEKCWPGRSRPSRCQRRTSIDLQPSQVRRPPVAGTNAQLDITASRVPGRICASNRGERQPRGFHRNTLVRYVRSPARSWSHQLREAAAGSTNFLPTRTQMRKASPSTSGAAFGRST
jgi:hypothetical protein